MITCCFWKRKCLDIPGEQPPKYSVCFGIFCILFFVPKRLNQLCPGQSTCTIPLWLGPCPIACTHTLWGPAICTSWAMKAVSALVSMNMPIWNHHGAPVFVVGVWQVGCSLARFIWNNTRHRGFITRDRKLTRTGCLLRTRRKARSWNQAEASGFAPVLVLSRYKSGKQLLCWIETKIESLCWYFYNIGKEPETVQIKTAN